MKILGQTNLNVTSEDINSMWRYIVELRRDECLELIKLAYALKGRQLHHSDYDLQSSSEFDLSQVLKAINAFSSVKYSVEQIKEMLQELDNKLMSNNDK